MTDPQIIRPLPCIVCGTHPEPAFRNANPTWQPSHATMFNAGSGHYGSTVWDHMTSGRSLTINVCDNCLIDRKHRTAVIHTLHPEPTHQLLAWNPDDDN